MATAQDVIKYADYLLTLNIHETPDGSNIAHPITDWARLYGGSTGDAWCSWTISFIYHHTDPSLVYGLASGYSGTWRSMGQKYGLMIPGPAPGAIDVMDFDGKPDFTDHVGLVRSVNRDGSWVNFEGNHGNRYGLVTRAPGGGSHWFILPKYGTTPKPQEDDMGLAQIQQTITAGGIFETAGLVQASRKAVVYLDLLNQGQTTANVSVKIQKSNGDFGEKAFTVPISTGAAGRISQGLKSMEVGQVFGDANLGNILVWVSSDQPIIIIKSQTLV